MSKIVHAYVLAGDPAFLAASIRAYYRITERIVVSYDRDARGWAGEPIPLDACLREAKAVDPDGKVDLVPGSFSDPERPALDSETTQRQTALDVASEGADWVLQLDADEVLADVGAFSDALAQADAAAP